MENVALAIATYEIGANFRGVARHKPRGKIILVLKC